MKIDEERFRTNFKNLDDAVLLGYEHVAALMSITVGATYQAAAKGTLPKPAIRSNKLVRWTAGQIRECLNGLPSISETPKEIQLICTTVDRDESLAKKARIGRPRQISGQYLDKRARA